MDRFDDMAEAATMKYLKQTYPGGEDLAVWLAKLLRREHRRMVRLLKEELLPAPYALKSGRIEGWNQAIETILDRLNQRR
jgi:hypothetical protein